MKFKYLIFSDRNDEEKAILFADDNGITHKDVSRIHRASDVSLRVAAFCDVKPVVNEDQTVSFKVSVYPSAARKPLLS